MSLSEMVSEYIGIPHELVLEITKKAPRKYRRYLIKKKTGGYRSIYHPAKETKTVQYGLMKLLLDQLPVHDIATGYRKGMKSPLRLNALKHAPFSYTVHIDIERFFPSIVPEDLFNSINIYKPENNLNKGDLEFIENALFIGFHGSKSLPIGSPASPQVSNIVMYQLDEETLTFCRKMSDSFAITRYADDLHFSCNKKGICNNFVDEYERLLTRSKHPDIKINSTKTYYSSRGSRRVVTGLVITPEGKVCIPKEEKERVKKNLYLLSKDLEIETSFRWLNGYISFIRDVEPDFFNRLIIKYGYPTYQKLQLLCKEDQ